MTSERSAALAPPRARALVRWLVLAVVVSALLAGCDREPSAADAPDRVASPTPPAAAGPGDPAGGAPPAAAAAPGVERAVRVVRVDDGTLSASRRATATFRPSRESRVASAASGRVAEIAAREGAHVPRGDPLVLLESAALTRALDNARLSVDQARVQLERARRAQDEGVRQAAAAARAAEANLEVIEHQLAEAEALLAIGAVAASEVQSLRAQRDGAASTAVQARDALARSERGTDEEVALLELQLEQAEVQHAQALEALADAVVRAPFDGEVAELFVEVGEFVGAGSPVARVLGSGAQLVSFTVPPEDAPLLESIGRVRVVAAGLELDAVVERVERQAQQARLATVTARLAEDAPRLASGSVGEVHYELVLGHGPMVPSGALTADAGRTYVFVVLDDADGAVAVRREVRVLHESGNRAVVAPVDEGAIVAGTLVVAPRPLDVRDGTRVRVVEVAPAASGP